MNFKYTSVKYSHRAVHGSRSTYSSCICILVPFKQTLPIPLSISYDSCTNPESVPSIPVRKLGSETLGDVSTIIQFEMLAFIFKHRFSDQKSLALSLRPPKAHQCLWYYSTSLTPMRSCNSFHQAAFTAKTFLSNDRHHLFLFLGAVPHRMSLSYLPFELLQVLGYKINSIIYFLFISQIKIFQFLYL